MGTVFAVKAVFLMIFLIMIKLNQEKEILLYLYRKLLTHEKNTIPFSW